MAPKVNFDNFSKLCLALTTAYFVYAFSVGIAENGFTVTTILEVCSVFNQLLMGIYGLNSYYLLWSSLKTRTKITTPEMEGEWPKVTIQLPIYNEKYVIERLIRKSLLIEYPADKLEIQVLDDSNDGTCDVVKKCLDELRKTTKIKLTHIRRDNRINFKAGALVVGTAQATGEFLAIFDADFVPNVEFLMKTIPHFREKKVGCVQCRWGHLNYNYSLFTRLQSIGHDGHFVIEQHAKSNNGICLNFNGTAGVWRRSCVVDAGDWSGDTLAEDLDLSYRAQLAGWNIKYLRDIEVPAEVPLSISAFKKQQARWAKGSMQTALKLIRRVWDSDVLSLMQKVQASVHLFGYMVHPLMMVNLMLTLCLFYLAPQTGGVNLMLFFVLFISLGPPLIVICSQIYLGHPSRIFLMPLLIILHHGLCINNASAVFEAFSGKKGSFERTPKFGDLQLGEKWFGTQYAKNLKNTQLPWGEMVLCSFICCSMVVGLFVPVNYSTYPWLMFFSMGFGLVIGLHLQERGGMNRLMAGAGKAKKTL